MRVPKAGMMPASCLLVSPVQNAYNKNELLGNMSHESADPPDTFPLESFLSNARFSLERNEPYRQNSLPFCSNLLKQLPSVSY